MSDRLKVKLGEFELINPVIPASGTFGFGYEFVSYYDINILPTISLKGTTLKEKYGNELPRIAECKDGLLNSVGLQNPGVDEVINREIKELKKVYDKKVIANINGSTIEEYLEVARRFDKCDDVFALEVNVSCPNVNHGGLAFGIDKDIVYDLVRKLKEVTSKFLIVKLTPNITNIKEIAISAEKGGADAISLINTILAMRIDIKKRKPILGNITGGYSGPAVFPIALRMVREVFMSVKIPVIGMGGVSCARDVIEMMMAGASAVMVGSANMVDPYACYKIINELEKEMDKYKIENISDIIGGSK
jgi:dihydroorotate dehydrogenase (NAD+) catalytic subunit